MILALTAAVALQAAVAPSDDIVVIGQRLQGLSASVTRDGAGRYHCALDGSSGNGGLDASLCRVATDCVRKGATEQSAVSACVDQRKPKLLANLRAELTKARR